MQETAANEICTIKPLPLSPSWREGWGAAGGMGNMLALLQCLVSDLEEAAVLVDARLARNLRSQGNVVSEDAANNTNCTKEDQALTW